MKEQEAIERIAKALGNNPNLSDTPVDYLHEAGVAWNEMKAIARETPAPRPCPNPDDHYHYIDGHEMGQA